MSAEELVPVRCACGCVATVCNVIGRSLAEMLSGLLVADSRDGGHLTTVGLDDPPGSEFIARLDCGCGCERQVGWLVVRGSLDAELLRPREICDECGGASTALDDLVRAISSRLRAVEHDNETEEGARAWTVALEEAREAREERLRAAAEEARHLPRLEVLFADGDVHFKLDGRAVRVREDVIEVMSPHPDVDVGPDESREWVQVKVRGYSWIHRLPYIELLPPRRAMMVMELDTPVRWPPT